MTALLKTRFTDRFDLCHPVALAPMAGAAGGALTAAVARAGGLGLLGGGYGDPAWLAAEYARAGGAPIGVGFITWSLSPELLEQTLARRPRAVMLSFGDLSPFAAQIKAAGVPLIAQIQCLDHARAALDAGADLLVAQGAEAGGHGASRASMTLVPEVADLLAARAPEVLLLAAGGIADGRGLAAALMLGADGALIGSRFWAAAEALVPAPFHEAICAATGDQTLRSSVPDAARALHWPAPFTIRTYASDFIRRWLPATEALRADPEARAAWAAAQARGDVAASSPIFGEAAGLIGSIRPAGEILDEITSQAAALLQRGAALCASPETES